MHNFWRKTAVSSATAIMAITKRFNKKRVLLFTILAMFCYILIARHSEPRDDDDGFSKRMRKVGMQSQLYGQLKRVNMTKEKTKQDEVYNELLIERIGKRIEKFKDYRIAESRGNSSNPEPAPKGIAEKVGVLLGQKIAGKYMEIGIGQDEEDGLVQWLEKDMDWSGLVLEPNVQVYNYGVNERARSQVFRPCIQIGEWAWHHSTDPVVQRDTNCYPLGAVVQAAFGGNFTQPDLLLLNSEGSELEILAAFPFSRYKVKAMLIALRGALVDTTDFHRILDIKGYKSKMIYNNHLLRRTYIIAERLLQYGT